jgi:photosystem II stability/assembly factor-like uncharacterized protein
MNKKNWSALVGAILLVAAGATFGGTNVWTDTGPLAADVKVKFSSSADIAYARGGDRLWKSTNGGQDWTALAPRNTSYYPFAVDPTDPNLVIFGADNFGGLLRSTDGGQSFSQVSFANFYALEFCADASVAYGVNNFATTEIMRSVDRGANWTARGATGLPLNAGSSNLVPVPYSLGVDHGNFSTVYAGFRHPDYQGIYRSLDGGQTWSPGTGLLGINVNEIAPHPVTAGQVLVATSAGVFRSVDSGATWSRVADPASTGVATLDIQSVAFDRANPLMIYAGGAQRGEIFFSADGGATWSRRGSGVLANKINSLAGRPGHAGEVLAGTSHTLYRSVNSAQNWSVSANGIQAASVESLQNGSRLRAGLTDGGVYESLDGSTWTPLNNEGLRTRMPDGKFSGIVGILEGNRLLVMPFQSPMLSSTTQGATWQPAPTSFPSSAFYQYGGLITVSGSGPAHLAATSWGMYKTIDDGATWFWSGTGLPNAAVVKITKKADGSALYAGTANQGMYKSTDGGGTWVAANGTGLANLEIKSLAYDDINDVLLVGTYQGLFASSNGGASYTQLTNPWPTAQMAVDAIVVEDFVHGALYVAFQKKVFRSVDSGQTWTELGDGNPYSDSFVRITSMVSDGPGVLYMGRWAGGISAFTVSPDINIIAAPPAVGALPIGTELPWQFIVQNAGPYASTFTQASWQVPANVDVLNVATSRGTCALSASHRLSCDIGVLAANQPATVTMTLRGNSGGTLGINLSAGAAEIDRIPTNNTYTNSAVRFVESVDLAATLSISPLLVNSGTALDYTLVVSNNGPNAASGGSFETTFDARDQYVLAQGSATGCTGNVAGLQVCPLPTIASGASLTYRWTVTPQWGGARTPAVIVRPDTQNSLDTNQVNNTASATANVVPITDLSTSLTSAAPNVLQGSPLALTATVTNNSLIDAAGVTATLTLSDRMTFSSATGAVCTSTGNVVGCAVGVLGAGASRAITINVNAVTAGSATNTFSAASVGPDPVLPNNSSNLAVTIDPTNDLSVTLTSASSASSNGPVVLTLTGTNLSANEATGVRADVTLSALVTYASATGATCTAVAAAVTCDLGTIAGNSSKVVSITVGAGSAGTATNSATITGGAPDPVATNNASSAQIVIAAAPPPPVGGGSSSGGGGGGGGGSFDLLSLLALAGVLASMQSQRRRAATAAS